MSSESTGLRESLRRKKRRRRSAASICWSWAVRPRRMRATESIARYLRLLAPEGVQHVAAAAFRTRLRRPSWVWGSAAATIERELVRAGARLIVPAASFNATMTRHGLAAGELEHAPAWAASLPHATIAPILKQRTC